MILNCSIKSIKKMTFENDFVLILAEIKLKFLELA